MATNFVKSLNKEYFALIILISFLLCFGYYLQYFENLEPCSLCLIQRFFYICIFVFSSICLILSRLSLPCLLSLGGATITAFSGALVALRQVWLQRFSDSNSIECGPDLSFMLENFSIASTLKSLYQGTSDCATIKWQFMGGSIADWSLFFFILIFAYCAYLISLVMKS